MIPERDLRAQFSRQGYTNQIKSITCQENPNGNYAFVDVESTQVAKDILSKLNGMPVNGMTLPMRLRTASDTAKKQPAVKKSPPKDLPPDEPSDLFTKVWVGFGQEKNEQKTKEIANELQILFSRVGEIKKFETNSNRKGNVAFITYESPLHAKKAISTYNHRVVKGHKIAVRRGNPSVDDHESSDKSKQLQEQVTMLRETNDDLKMQVNYLKRQKEKRMDEIKQLQREKDIKQEEIKGLKEEVLEYKKTGIDHIDRITDLREELVSVREKSLIFQEEHRKINEENRRLRDENRRLAKEMDVLRDKLNNNIGHNNSNHKNRKNSGGNKARRPKNNYKGRDKKNKRVERDNQDNQVSPQQGKNQKSSRGRKKNRGRGLFQNAVDQAHASNSSRGNRGGGRGRGRGGGRGRNNYKKNKKSADSSNLPAAPDVRKEANV